MRLLFFAASWLAMGIVSAEAQATLRIENEDFSFQQIKSPQNVDFGYFLSSSRWPSEPDGRTIVFVCWINPSPLFNDEMNLVKQAISETWQKHSKLEFRGWQPCVPDHRGIKIRIRDVTESGPHVKALGKGLYQRDDGMELNFTFQHWGQSCLETPTKRASCIRSISVHEFGHAIGFAHEHNRWDRAGECRETPQGTSGDVMLTPYDKSSVMNYCNLVYNNNGLLSALDVTAVQAIYGKPK